MTGVTIYMIGQVIPNFHIHFDLTDQTAVNPMAGILIFIAMFLTGFKVYDRICRLFHLKVSVMPLYPQQLNTGRGFVLGDGCNIFKSAEGFMLFQNFIFALTILLQWGGL